MLPQLPRIVIVGVSGSGKTSLAQAISGRLALPHTELDALYWGPNWTPVTEERFRARAAAAAEGLGWVLDGNYRLSREVVWPRANLFIWLDYPYPLVLGRLLRRTLRRGLTRETLWEGSHERLLSQFKLWSPQESILAWQAKTYNRYRREYARLLPPHAGARLLRFRHPSQAADWLQAQPAFRFNELALEGIALFNRADFFAAHEALEEAWRGTAHPVRDLYRGLLQLSVVCLHLQRGNRVGADKVWRRSQRWLGKWPPVVAGVHLGQVQRQVDALRREGRPPAVWPQIQVAPSPN